MLDLTPYQHALIYGGSFDPPHNAHVRLPAIVAEKIGADALVYVPTGRQPLKLDQPQTEPRHRLAMLRLALDDQPNALIETDEIDRHDGDDARPSYTAETLERIRQHNGQTPRLSLLIGADALAAFWRWHQPQRILELAAPVVIMRPPDDREKLLATLPRDQDPGWWASRLVDVPQMDVSSSVIRRRVAQALPIHDQVSPAVQSYIREHRLYAPEQQGHVA